MIVIPGYGIKEKIFEDSKVIIYEGFVEKDNTPVFLEALKSNNPDAEDINKLKDIFVVNSRLNGLDGILESIDFIQSNNIYAHVFEYFRGKYLKQIIGSGLPLNIFLKIAIKISSVLSSIHANNSIHCNIKPDIIAVPLANTDSVLEDISSIKITGLRSPAFIIQDTANTKTPSILDISLEYISPEQTGRMSRSVDYRTDFYSLGIMFYEMLTGHVPFRSDDAMELIYYHIAKEPEPLPRINNIPSMVSSIIMKLLSKNPEERYQCALGLKHDLETCLEQYEKLGVIQSFSLGEKDIVHKLQFPQKLFGRDEEKEKLLRIFESVCSGNSELTLVSGFAGVGKTALINELHIPVVKSNGYYIRSKFERLNMEIPFSAVIEAFRHLIRHLLTENEQEIRLWRDKFLEALHPNARLLIDVIPELELIIGKQAPVSEVGFAEAQNRYKIYFQKFVRVFSSNKHPLVLFLDDLQWADSASLNLLNDLITDYDTRYLLIIGAYRDIDVDESHKLIRAIEEIKFYKKPHEISLSSLSEKNLNSFIASIIRSPEDNTSSLSSVVYKKTQGNPFFAIELLKSLYNDKILTFNNEAGWFWDTGAIIHAKASDNVIELLANNFTKLSGNTQDKLKICACMGSSFDVEILSEVFNKSILECLSDMAELVNEGFLTLSERTYSFSHDRIHEAVYSFINDKEKMDLHLLIGKIVLKKTTGKDITDNIFYIVNQLNYGSSNMKNQNEKYELAELNLLAGKKAKESTAYSSAVSYLRAGKNMLSEDSWKNNYDLIYLINKELAECEYLNGNFDEAEHIFNSLLDKVTNNIDKVRIYNIMVILYTNIGKINEALRIGIEAIEVFGIKISEKPSSIRVLFELLKYKWNMRSRKIEDLLFHKEIRDPEKLAFLELLTNLGTPAFYINNKLFALIVLYVINIYLKNGNSDFASPTYVALGVIVGIHLKDLDSGYKFGELALRLNEKYDNKRFACQLEFMFAYFIQHWKKHAQNDIQVFRKAYELGIVSGNIIYSGHCINIAAIYRFIAGNNLDDIFKEYKGYDDFIKNTNDPLIVGNFMDFYQVYLDLKDRKDPLHRLNGMEYDKDRQLELTRERQISLELCNYLHNRIKISYLLGRYQECYEYAKELNDLNIPAGTLFFTEHIYYYSLAMTAVYMEIEKHKKSKLWKMLKRNQEAMKRWADSCPGNFMHKYYLISAEMFRLSGDKDKAMLNYDLAIKNARNNKYLNDEGIANELAGKFYIELGFGKIAKVYFTESYNSFHKWGADAKANQLKNNFYDIFNEKDKSSEISDNSEAGAQEEPVQTTDSSNLDVATILKVSQAISEEINLDKLLQIIMKIVLQNSGAQKAFLIIERDGELNIEAEGSIDKDEIKVLHSISIKKNRDISQSIVNFVARTDENVVLNNAAESSFIDDIYILENKPKSILCTNFGHYSKTISGRKVILYLENNITIGAFTPERLEVLRSISKQVAISLENARLYRGQQIALDKLQKLDALKDEFLSNTSHELRTPLLGIIGLAESLMDGATGKLSGKTRENLSMIISSCRRLSNLVNDIMDLSKIKNNDLKLQKQRVDLKQITDIVIIFSKTLLNGKEIELKNDIPDDFPNVYADGNRLMQIMYNLIGNAVKFTESGEIKIYANRQPPGKDGEKMIEVIVEDTGIGIPEDKYESIFNNFEQVDGSVSRAYGGVGLGLSITKQLVQLHGGAIRVESNIHKGSSFIFILPVYESLINTSGVEEVFYQDADSAKLKTIENKSTIDLFKEMPDYNASYSEESNKLSSSPATGSNSDSSRILAVDDELINLRVLENQLGLAGYNVIAADSGAKALEILDREKLPDIVLLDIMMPGMSGYEVCSSIRERYSLYELPILIFTAKSQVIDIVTGFDSGANDYLPKPFDKRELLARVNTLIKLKKTVREYEESRFKNLHNRMNPHFLFNSIHAIHALIHTDVDKADKGIIKLSEIYRFLMDTSLSNSVPFMEEWDFVKNYLEFEKIRFPDILSYKVDLKGDFSNITIPPLTIQPLVENSIKHGLRQKPDHGLVEVYAERNNGFIKIEVLDDGININKENIYSRTLGNIKDRLKYHFKESDLKIENRVQGVKACITFSVSS